MTFSSEVTQIVQCDFCDSKNPNIFRLTMDTPDWENEMFVAGWALLQVEAYAKVSTHACPDCIRTAIVRTYVA